MNEFGHENDGIFNVPLISEEWFGGEGIIHPFPMTLEQVNLLINCASYNWRNIEPMILGSFVEQCFTNAQRLAGGIHFTRENDVMLIVQPLIVDYFRRQIDNVGGGTINVTINTIRFYRKYRIFLFWSQLLEEVISCTLPTENYAESKMKLFPLSGSCRTVTLGYQLLDLMPEIYTGWNTKHGLLG